MCYMVWSCYVLLWCHTLHGVELLCTVVVSHVVVLYVKCYKVLWYYVSFATECTHLLCFPFTHGQQRDTVASKAVCTWHS